MSNKIIGITVGTSINPEKIGERLKPVQTINGVKPDANGNVKMEPLQGPPGEKGEKGDTGAQGVQGVQGLQGIQGEKGERGEKGETGAKGDKGDPFSIAKIYSSVAAMNAGYSSDGVAKGAFVAIDTGNVEDEENARLYIKGESAYVFLTDLSGAQGIKGDKGEKGDKGDNGATGDRGPQGEQGVQGIQGIPGEKGDTGATGKSAYAYAKEAGFTGTESKFATILASTPEWESVEYIPSDTVVISEQTLSSMMWSKRQMDINIGITYAVYINYKLYLCMAYEEDGTICLGNPTLFHAGSTIQHNNEPFCITWAGGTATAGMFHKDNSLSYPLKLQVTSCATIRGPKIPKSYLPSTMAMKSDIPDVSGMVKSVNGNKPDANGNVAIETSGGGGTSIDVTASVGQTIIVKEVDANGKPTKWESAEYQEKICGKEVKLIYPEQNCVFNEDLGAFIAQGDTSLTVGNTYIVNYNGVDYTEKCVSVSTPDGVFVGFGNFDAMLETGDNGVPFVIIDGSVLGASGMVGVMPVDGSASITLSIKEETFTQIPQDFLANAFPYYIYCNIETADGSGIKSGTVNDTVANVEAAFNRGRDIRLRFTEIDGNLASTHILGLVKCVDTTLAKVFYFSSAVYAYGGEFMQGVGLYLIPQADGTYKASSSIGD